MKKALLLFVIIFWSYCSYAQIMAADIGYQHISGNTYKITIRTFSNTLGAFADQCELIVYFGNGDSAIFERINGPSFQCPGDNELGQSVSKIPVKNALSKFDLHGLPSGMYFYRLSGKNTTLSSGKFIISGDPIK